MFYTFSMLTPDLSIRVLTYPPANGRCPFPAFLGMTAVFLLFALTAATTHDSCMKAGAVYPGPACLSAGDTKSHKTWLLVC